MPTTDEFEVLSPTGVAVRLPVAGAGSRAWAFVIDWHIRVTAAALWALTAAVLAGLTGDGGGPLSGARAVLLVLPIVVLYFGYHPILELLMQGNTPGKRMAGVRVVDAEGRPPTASAILIRSVFRLIDSLPALYAVGLISCVATKHAQRLGDLAAGTMLIYATAPTDAADFDDRTVSASTNPRAALAQDLLARWNDLLPARRSALAARLLDGEGAEPGTDDVLKARLAEVTRGG